jgi:hypothetical protein
VGKNLPLSNSKAIGWKMRQSWDLWGSIPLRLNPRLIDTAVLRQAAVSFATLRQIWVRCIETAVWQRWSAFRWYQVWISTTEHADFRKHFRNYVSKQVPVWWGVLDLKFGPKTGCLDCAFGYLL